GEGRQLLKGKHKGDGRGRRHFPRRKKHPLRSPNGPENHGSFLRDGIVPVTYERMSEIILYGGSDTNSVTVPGSPAGSFTDVGVNGSNSTVMFGSNAPKLGGTIANFLGSVRVQAAPGATPNVIINDSGDSAPAPDRRGQ